MSYILEALKKSERVRRRDTVPNLQSVHETITEHPPRKVSRPGLLVLVLAINAAILAWYFYPTTDQPSQGTATMIPDTDSQMSVAGGLMEPELTMDAAVTTSEPGGSNHSDAEDLYIPDITGQERPEHGTPDLDVAASRIEPTQEPDKEITVADPTTPEPEPPVEHLQATGDIIAAVSAEIVPPTSSADATGNRPAVNDDPYQEVPWLDSLSTSFRDGLPPMEISIHAHAVKQSARLVRINGRIFREGQQVSKDLMLEAITEAGMIMEYQGQRFRMYVISR